MPTVDHIVAAQFESTDCIIRNVDSDVIRSVVDVAESVVERFEERKDEDPGEFDCSSYLYADKSLSASDDPGDFAHP